MHRSSINPMSYHGLSYLDAQECGEIGIFATGLYTTSTTPIAADAGSTSTSSMAKPQNLVDAYRMSMCKDPSSFHARIVATVVTSSTMMFQATQVGCVGLQKVF